MSSAPSFVKVKFGESQLVVPCGKGTDKVSRLIQDINRRFQSYLGDPTARVKELWTADGFYINPNDAIMEVVADGSFIIASDYNAWMKDQLELLKESWHLVERKDFVDDERIWADVGLHKHNKIYVKLGVGKAPSRLELFSLEELQSFGKGGKPLIARDQTKDESKGIERFVEASFVVTGTSVTAVELTVKATSDTRPQVERFSLPTGPDMKKGTATVVQSADYPVPSKKYTLPVSSRKGKTLEQVMKCISKDDDAETPQKDHEGNKSTGTCAIEMKQKEPAQADQSWYDEKSKSFTQYVYINLSLLNKQDKPIAITDVHAEYLNKEGKWQSCDSISLGYRSGLWYYSWNQIDPKGFNLPESITTDMAVRAGIEVNAMSYDKLRRIHHSLPDPISIKIWMEDGDGGKSSIVVEYKSGPLVVLTAETKKNDSGKDELWFAYCDDIDAEARIWAMIVKEEDASWGTIVQYSNWKGSGSKYFYADDMKKVLYEATKANKSEFLVEGCTYKDEKVGCEATVTALVDLKEHYVYGLKVDLTTGTGSTSDCYLIPPYQKAAK